MQDFAAIDFETANNDRSSVCSVGVVIVRDGEIVDSFSARAELLQLLVLAGARALLRRYGRCAALSGGLGADRTADRGPSSCGAQQTFRRELPEGRLPRVSDGLSRLRVLRHALCFKESLSLSAESSAAYCGGGVRLSSGEPPSRPCRCRSLCLDCEGDLVALSKFWRRTVDDVVMASPSGKSYAPTGEKFRAHGKVKICSTQTTQANNIRPSTSQTIRKT